MVDTGAPVGPGSHASHGTADGGAFEQSEIGRCLMNAMKAIASSPTFSHTGVEQAIEACAKVAESVRDRPGHTIGHDACTHRDGERVAANEIAAAIRATLPAQSPDDIAYAGAAASPVNVEGLVAALRPFATFYDDFADADGWTGATNKERIDDWFGPSDFRLARRALASLSPDGER